MQKKKSLLQMYVKGAVDLAHTLCTYVAHNVQHLKKKKSIEYPNMARIVYRKCMCVCYSCINALTTLLLYNAFDKEEEAGPSGLALQEAVL